MSVHTLILGTCEDASLHGPKDFADVINNTEWGEEPGLPRWAPSSHTSPSGKNLSQVWSEGGVAVEGSSESCIPAGFEAGGRGPSHGMQTASGNGQEVGSPSEPPGGNLVLLTPQTCQAYARLCLQNWKVIHLCCLRHSVSDNLLWQL